MHKMIIMTGAGYANVEKMKEDIGAIGTGLAICPIVHLAALQEIQPILAADDYAREHNLAEHERETQADKGQGGGSETWTIMLENKILRGLPC